MRKRVEIEPKLVGRESEVARDWKNKRDSNEVYADKGGIPHCPSGRPLGEKALRMGATVVGRRSGWSRKVLTCELRGLGWLDWLVFRDSERDKLETQYA